MTSPREHWASAGRCWLSIGDEDEALRCFEAAAAWGSLGVLHERKGRFLEAARAYERSQQWVDAARCFHAAGRWEPAGRCLARAELPMRRAWTLVHEMGLVAEAEKVIDAAPMRDVAETVSMTLVRARCDVARGDHAAAAKKLRDVFPDLARVSPASGYRCVTEWAVLIGESMRRPDLSALALAAGPRGVEADELWERWSSRVFGEVVPPPFSLHAREDEEANAG
ncbi:hypothetical protein QHF83_17690 [Polyangium sp. 15x6]|nr:hypothetical protein [Polyangium sp. 15x6]